MPDSGERKPRGEAKNLKKALRIPGACDGATPQVQGVIFVQVPVRMTVVKLDDGGLFVYSAVAPTAECLRLLAELEAESAAAPATAETRIIH